jgi:hypothetical protein
VLISYREAGNARGSIEELRPVFGTPGTVDPPEPPVPPVVVQVAGRVIVLELRLTAPLRDRSRPCKVAPVFIVEVIRDMIVPTKVDPVPSVVELVTCQKTLQA